MTGSLFAALAAADGDADKGRQAFTASSADIASVLKLAIQHEQDLVSSATAFVVSNPNSSNAQLRSWTATLLAGQPYPALQGLAAVVYVPNSQLGRFAARAEADPTGPLGPKNTFVVIPAGQRPYYCFSQAIGFRAPGASALPAGTDLCATSLGSAFLGARDSGLPSYIPDTLGGPSSLIVETPVYRGGVVPATVLQRRAAFLAEIGVGISPQDLLDTALNGHPGTAMAFHYRNGSEAITFSSGVVRRGWQQVDIRLGPQWTVTVFGPAVAGGVLDNGNSSGLLIAGLVISLLLAVLAGAFNRLSRKTDQSRHQALHDALTGLPNRTLILARVEELLIRNRRNGTTCAALFVDLDEFKNVNDSNGHVAGDELIRAVAERLSTNLREADTIGRLGGDEFVVLIDAGKDISGIESVAARLLEVLRRPFEVSFAAWPLTVTASVGVALGGDGSAGDLLRDADLALYQAKGAGKNCYRLFHADMEATFRQRLDREFELRSALEGGQFCLAYQPIVDLATGEVEGVEALLRWDHPSEGMIWPSDFIPLAEETGLIVQVGEWVLGEACRQVQSWRRAYPELGHLSVSVNLSGCQIAQTDLVEVVANVLLATGLPADRLVLEITESVLMRDADSTVAILTALKALGVRLGIDDFGTGYSSLSYLKKFPVDILKVDQTFVAGLSSGPQDSAIVEATITLAHALGLTTTAEGVETVHQAQILAGFGCDKAQGYLICRPGIAANMVEILRHGLFFNPPQGEGDSPSRAPMGTVAGFLD
jgi:diguanylate cyclase (GGDEF)-like protein